MEDNVVKPDENDLAGESLTETETPPVANGAQDPGTVAPPPEKKADPKPNPDQNTPKEPLLKRIRNFKYLYLIIFIILFVAACVVIVIALKWGKSATKETNKKPTSLTSSELSQLSGSTTVVGDSKQTLDVQSAAVFEGQVLVRSDLNVAGALKVGSSLSLPSLTTGSGSFGQLQVNDTLSVSGNGTVQGQLSVQKNLTVAGSASFGTLSASQLNVSSLQLSGDLTINRHISPGGGIPSRSNGSALGGGGTVSVSGSDTAGTVSINTGGGPPAGCFVTVNFTQKFNTTPHVVISPANSAAAGLDYYTNRSNTSFSVCSLSAPSGGANYVFDYIVFD